MTTHHEDVWLGVDLGTQGVRAVALDTDGRALASAHAPLSSRREHGRHEQDPRSWWSATADVLRAVTGQLPAAAHVRGVATCGTSGTFVLLDGGGSPAGPAVMYDDARAVGRNLPAQGEAVAWLAAELGYRVQPTWALSKLVALATDGELPPGSRPVHQPDMVNSFLVGGPVATDTSSALKTGVDPRAVGWPEVVRAAVGPGVRLPEVVLPGTAIGTVSAAAAAETGLPAGASVIAGMTDGCAAQLAAGALQVGDWNSVVGTTLVCKGVSRELVRDRTGVTYSHRSADGAWLPGAASSAGLGVLPELFPDADLDALSQEGLARRRPVCYPLRGTGERFPFSAPDATGFVLVDGHQLPVDAGTRELLGAPAMLGSLLTGIACTERLCFDVLGAAGYDVSGRIRLTGGATRNPLLTALRARMLGRAVEVPAQAEPAAGMAILAAWAGSREPGVTLADRAARMVTVDAVAEPDGHPGLPSREVLDEDYGRFREELVASGRVRESPVGEPR